MNHSILSWWLSSATITSKTSRQQRPIATIGKLYVAKSLAKLRRQNLQQHWTCRRCPNDNAKVRGCPHRDWVRALPSALYLKDIESKLWTVSQSRGVQCLTCVGSKLWMAQLDERSIRHECNIQTEHGKKPIHMKHVIVRVHLAHDGFECSTPCILYSIRVSCYVTTFAFLPLLHSWYARWHSKSIVMKLGCMRLHLGL